MKYILLFFALLLTGCYNPEWPDTERIDSTAVRMTNTKGYWSFKIHEITDSDGCEYIVVRDQGIAIHPKIMQPEGCSTDLNLWVRE